MNQLQRGDDLQFNKVEICGVNTAKLKVLKESEKMELLKKARAGDKKAREELVIGNLRLVLSVIQRFANRGENPDDLFQVGCIGLIKATDAFDTERGLCFSTYAVPVIMGEMRRLFRDGGAVKVSRSVKELSLKIAREKQKLEQKLCREPTVCEIAAALEVSPEEITEALCASQPTVSLTYDGEDGICETDLPTVSTEDEISDKLL